MLTHKNHQHGPSGARAKYWFLMKSMDCCNNPCGQSLEVEEEECQARHVMTDNITTWRFSEWWFQSIPKPWTSIFIIPFLELMEPLKETLKALNKTHYRHFQWPKDPKVGGSLDHHKKSRPVRAQVSKGPSWASKNSVRSWWDHGTNDATWCYWFSLDYSTLWLFNITMENHHFW